MATFTSYFKIITPKSKNPNYLQIAQDNINQYYYQSGAAASVNWYSQILKGAGSRLQRYSQFEIMDTDPDVSKALDIIAEEISNDDLKTNLPFEIEYQVEDDSEVSEAIVTTLRAAVRKWTKVQDLNNRIFRIARYLIKYGDCFFKKSKETNKWEWVDPNKIFGIEIDGEGNKINYHIKSSKAKIGLGAFSSETMEVVPAQAMVHFTLSDDMGEGAPFGDSILIPGIKVFRQLSALEDSVVIYRIVRAPEKRVFKIDGGNIPPQRQKQYLEVVRNELRQSRIPNATGGKGGTEIVDGTYNPQSINEDFFFIQNAQGRSSSVEILSGGDNLGELSELSYFKKKLFASLRVPMSYITSMSSDGSSQGMQWNDGKLGVAYIEELRFANFVKRLQNKLEKVFDAEFKKYLTAINLNIDENLYILRLPDPQNFGNYKQLALDADYINAYKSIEDSKVLSARFKLKRYLGLSEDELQMNESMLKQELEIAENSNVSDLKQIYDPVQAESRRAIKVKPLMPEGGEEGGGEEGMGGGDMGGEPGGFGGGGDELGGMGGGEEPGGLGGLGGL